jgi:hypothetical protein
MAIGDKVFATKPFGYNGQTLDPRQVVELAGCRNDEKLVRMGYFNPMPKGKVETFKCGVCGAIFVTEGDRFIHGNRRHGGATEKPAELEASAAA